MTKRQLTKAAFKKIVQEKLPHQEVYEELRKDTLLSDYEVATIVGRFPSKQKIAANASWKMVFIGLLALIILLRIIGFFALGLEMEMRGPVLLVLITFSIIVPVIGIVQAINNRPEVYQFIPILFIFFGFRSLDQLSKSEPIMWLGLIPYIAVIALGFWMMFRLKTPFKTVSVQETVNSEEKTVVSYIFENESMTNKDDLLDSRF